MINTFPSLALPCPPPNTNPEPEWGQLSRGGVEWVGSISQYRKWGGGYALHSSGDGVLAFLIAPIPAGEEVTRENAFGSHPHPHPQAAAVLGHGWRRRYPHFHHQGWGFRRWGQDASGRPKSEQMCSQGALEGRQKRGRQGLRMKTRAQAVLSLCSPQLGGIDGA